MDETTVTLDYAFNWGIPGRKLFKIKSLLRMIMPGTVIKADTLVQRSLWLVKLTKIAAFCSVPLSESLICKLGIRMHSSLCVDETGCTKAQLYKGNLVS